MVLKPVKRRGILSRFFNFRGLAFRSGLYFLLGIGLVLIISFGYILVYALTIMMRETESHATNITNLTISRIETILHPVEEVTSAMATSIERDEQGYAEVLKMSREYVKASPVVFGTCLAFEPYSYKSDLYYFAPYFYENSYGWRSKVLGSGDYDYFSYDWYKIPKEQNASGWSEPYYDKGGGDALLCTYSVPFYRMLKDSTRKFKGVLTMDISLKSLENIVTSVKVFESGFALLISKDGKVLTSPDPALVNKDINEIASDLKEKIKNDNGIKFGVVNEMSDVTDSIMQGKTGFANAGNIMKNGKSGTMYYAPVGNTGWSLVVIFASEELFSDLVNFLKKLGGVILASMIGALFITILVVRKVARPIRKLTLAAVQIGQGDFHVPVPVFRSRNEIAQLANAFAAMQEEIQTYIKNLKDTTTAKEKIESELNVAHEIQIGMLPKIFPSQPECDVYAILKPAKAVGGDLYDFFFTDETHLCFVIGDVSGKSVPASLFMAVTRTLFRAKTVNGTRLNKVMEAINNELCKDNPNMMFVTFQAAILDLQTGVVEICNAGHNYPFLQRRDNSITKYKCKPGLPLGVMENIQYESETLILQPHECILMYTDGITEAINLKESFFKEDKLIKSMLALQDGSAMEIANNLLKDVKDFTEDAEQSDDITLLVVKYRGERKERVKSESVILALENDVKELPKITAALEGLADKWKIPPKTVMEINLALEEWVTNIIFYGFEDKDKHNILIGMTRREEGIDITVTDEGKEFNPMDHPVPTGLDSALDERMVGGLGIHFIRQVMDSVEYMRENNKNILTLKKKINY